MTTTSASIQALIDGKVAEIAALQVRINELIPLTTPTYSIDGQSVVSYGPILDGLFSDQAKAIDCLPNLYKLQNIIAPYIFVSAPGGRY